MVSGSLARRYAKAVFEIGAAQGNLEKLGSDLRTLGKAMKDSPELAPTLASPAIRRGDRRNILAGLLGAIQAHAMTSNLVNLLLDGERLSSLPAISRELDAMIEAKAGRVVAEVTSAKPLDPSQLSQITAALEKLSGKQITIVKREDPELLGGVVAKLGDIVYDGSLRSQLRTLQGELTK